MMTARSTPGCTRTSKVLPFTTITVPADHSREYFRLLKTEGSQVATLTNDSKVHWQKIQIGRDFGTEAWRPLSGLEENAKVVVNPTDDLQRRPASAGQAPTALPRKTDNQRHSRITRIAVIKTRSRSKRRRNLQNRHPTFTPPLQAVLHFCVPARLSHASVPIDSEGDRQARVHPVAHRLGQRVLGRGRAVHSYSMRLANSIRRHPRRADTSFPRFQSRAQPGDSKPPITPVAAPILSMKSATISSWKAKERSSAPIVLQTGRQAALRNGAIRNRNLTFSV